MSGKKRGPAAKAFGTDIPNDELSMDDLDHVVGGNAPVTTPREDELLPQTGGGLIAPPVIIVAGTNPDPAAPPAFDSAAGSNFMPVFDDIGAAPATAAQQLSMGALDPAQAVAQVEAHARANNTSEVSGLTDLLERSNGNKDIAAALTAGLESGTTEANLARLVKSGKLAADDAVEQLQRAVEALAKFAPDGETPTDGLFEVSVAHLHQAATAQRNADLVSYLNDAHNLDVRSGMVTMAADQAAADMAAGRITADAAIAQMTEAARKQGLPLDVGLTALLVETDGNATVAKQLGDRLNGGPGGSTLAPTMLSGDVYSAIQAGTVKYDEAVEIIRESIDVLARYAPARVEGTADMNFAEVLATLKHGAAANDGHFQVWLQREHAQELAIGTVLLHVENGLRYGPNAGIAEAVRLGTHYCWQQGLPTGFIYMALLADTKGDAGVAAELARQLNNGSWSAPSTFAQDLQQLMHEEKNDAANRKPAHMNLDLAADLIKEAVDVLAKYAPNHVQGSAHLNYCETLVGLQWGYWGESSSFRQDFRKEFAFEIKLGEVAAAAEYGITYAHTAYKNAAAYHPEGVHAGVYNAKYWTTHNAVPEVYAYLTVMGDAQAGTQGGTAAIAQQLGDNLINGSLEKNVATLVAQGKITIEQGVASLLEAVDALARHNKLPANMTAAVLKAYALDTLADESQLLGAGGTKMLAHLQANYASELQAGQTIDSALASGPANLAAASAYAANNLTYADMAKDLTGGRSILEVMAKSGMPWNQAEQFLVQMAGDRLVPMQVVGEQLQLLITNNNLDPAQVMSRIGDRVDQNTLRADVAVLLLSELSSRSNAMLPVADGIIDGFVAHGRISPDGLMSCLHNAVLGHTLTDQQALATLALIAGSANQQLAAVAGLEIAALVQRNHVEAAAAIAAIHNAATGGLLTPAQASSALITLAANTDAAVQLAAGAELAALAPREFAAAVHNAALANTLTAEAALAILAGAGTNGNAAVQSAVNAEIAQLIRAGETTADNAIAVLTRVAANASDAAQASVNGAIAAMVGAGLLTATHAVQVMMNLAAGGTEGVQRAVGHEISHLVAAGRMTADQACQTMTGMASTGSPALQAAIGVEMVALFAHKHMSAEQLWGNVWNSGLQPPTSTKFWTVMSAMMTEAGPDLQPYLANHSQNLMRSNWAMPGVAMAAVDSAVTSRALSPAQGAEALAIMISGFGAAASNPDDGFAAHAMRAISGEFANLVANDHITAARAMSEIIRVTMPYGLSIPLLMTVAGTNPEMQAGAGEAIARHCQEKNIPALQLANMIANSNLRDPQVRLCMWAGIAAQAPVGELRDLADRNITNMIYPERISHSSSFGNNRSANAGLIEVGGVAPEQAIRILAGLGTGDNANLRAVALNEIADLVYSPATLTRDGMQVDSAVKTLSQMAQRGDAAMQAFVGASLAAIVADGVDPATVVKSVTDGVLYDQLSTDRMLAMFSAAAGDGTASLRNAIADGMLTLVDYGRMTNAQLNTFMTNHVTDGLAQSLLVSRVIRGEMAPEAVTTQLNGLIASYVAANPSVDRNAVTSIALAELMMAVRAAVDAHKPEEDQNHWGSPPYNPVPGRLAALQESIEGNKTTMAQVLTGLGMMQLHQTTPAASNEVMLLTREAMQAYVLEVSGVNALKAEAEKTAADAARFFTNGWDWATTGDRAESKQGIFRNQVLADPRSYEAWTNFGSALLSGPVLGAIINKQVTDLDILSGQDELSNNRALLLVNVGSKLLVEMFKQDAVINAIGPSAAAALGAPAGLVSASCDALSNMVTGVMKVGVGSAIETASNMVMMFDDIHNGRNASANARQMGNYLLTTLSGVQASDARATGEHFTEMWSDIFSGRDAAGSAQGFGTGLANMVWTNNGYVNAAISGLTQGANAVANAAVTAGNAIANAGQSAVNTIRGWFNW